MSEIQEGQFHIVEPSAAYLRLVLLHEEMRRRRLSLMFIAFGFLAASIILRFTNSNVNNMVLEINTANILFWIRLFAIVLAIVLSLFNAFRAFQMSKVERNIISDLENRRDVHDTNLTYKSITEENSHLWSPPGIIFAIWICDFAIMIDQIIILYQK